jgi:hypothetical protein
MVVFLVLVAASMAMTMLASPQLLVCRSRREAVIFPQTRARRQRTKKNFWNPVSGARNSRLKAGSKLTEILRRCFKSGCLPNPVSAS